MKKRTNLTTKVITLMLAMVLVVSLFPTSVMAASTKGPSDGFCFIRIEKSETERITIFFPQAAAAGTTVEKVSGFSAIDDISLVFQKMNFSVFLSYLLPRIPITLLDRCICTFAAYGIYSRLRK